MHQLPLLLLAQAARAAKAEFLAQVSLALLKSLALLRAVVDVNLRSGCNGLHGLNVALLARIVPAEAGVVDA